MDIKTTHHLLQAVNILVLLLMFAAVAYATWASLTYWNGIGV